MWKAEWLTGSMQRSDEVLGKGKVPLPKAPAVPLLLACGGRKPSFETHVRAHLAFAHLPATGKPQKRWKCPATEDRVKKMCLI